MERSTGEMNGMAGAKHELGVIICRYCGEVIATIPTNGVKRFYGMCDRTDCFTRAGALRQPEGRTVSIIENND